MYVCMYVFNHSRYSLWGGCDKMSKLPVTVKNLWLFENTYRIKYTNEKQLFCQRKLKFDTSLEIDTK